MLDAPPRSDSIWPMKAFEFAFIYVRGGHGRTSFVGYSPNYPFQLSIQQKQIGGREAAADQRAPQQPWRVSAMRM